MGDRLRVEAALAFDYGKNKIGVHAVFGAVFFHNFTVFAGIKGLCHLGEGEPQQQNAKGNDSQGGDNSDG